MKTDNFIKGLIVVVLSVIVLGIAMCVTGELGHKAETIASILLGIGCIVGMVIWGFKEIPGIIKQIKEEMNK